VGKRSEDGQIFALFGAGWAKLFSELGVNRGVGRSTEIGIIRQNGKTG